MDRYGVTGQTTEVMLQRLKVATQQTISPSVAQSMKLDTWRDELLDALVYQLRAYVLAQHLDKHTEQRTEVVEFEVPDGWRQQWKQDHHDAAGWVIRWLARRRPVRTRTLSRRVTLSATWDQYAAFPEATIIVDDSLGAPVRWLTSEAITWVD